MTALKSRLSIVTACFLVAATPAHNPDRSADSAIRAAYVTLQNALLTNDAAALSSLLAPQFKHYDIDGSVENRDAYVTEQIANTPGLTIASLKVDVDSLTVRGSGADAKTTYTIVGTFANKSAPKPLRAEMHLADEWTLVGKTWKLRSITVRDVVSAVDGKVVEEQHTQTSPSRAAIAELRRRAVVIPTLALDADPDQFAGIGAAIGDARIIGMGEGTHGTSEFFAFKNRLFKYLVERKGFTVFAMEANWGAGLDVDRFIKTGRGTAQQAVASLGFWTWNTPEVVDLVRWMRDYNAAPGKHPVLSFVGVDMQNPMGAIGYLAGYLRVHDPTEVASARQALQCSADATAKYDAKPTPDCRAQVAALGQALAALNAPDVAIAQEAATNILQFLDFEGQPNDAQVELRDRDMASNVQWLAAQDSDAKIAIWAHNGHVGTTPELSYHSMGGYLRHVFGSAYYVIGQTFGSGTVRAVVSGHGLQAVRVPPNPHDTIVQAFAPLNAMAFLDLRSLPAASALHGFFSTQHSVSETGALMDPAHPDHGMPMVVPKSFDGLVYMPTSTAAVSATNAFHMQRAMRDNGGDWDVGGLAFDEVTASTTARGAVLTNGDPLNASPNYLLRRFDAKPYAGKSVTMSAEVRDDGLVGFVAPIIEAKHANASVAAMASGQAVGPPKGGGWVAMTQTLVVPDGASYIDAGFTAEGFGSVEVRNLQIAASH